MAADFHGFTGRSAVMRVVYEQIETFARTPIPVLLTGETGTGKNLAANAIHELTPARLKFERVNCAALPEALIDSELFGHRKGAFTGAHRDHRGLIARADGGTLFLDEIGELPTFAQAKLLHCVETGEFRPVGGERTRRSEFRLVSATNRDLAAMAREGTFRQDLRYRVSVATIRMPSLRERPEDIPLLATLFLRRFRRKAGMERVEVTDEALAYLARLPWPGNVRELNNVVQRIAAVTRAGVIDEDAVRGTIHDVDAHGASVPTRRQALREAEATAFRVALAAARGNRTRAAELLDVSEATFYRQLRVLREAGLIDTDPADSQI